MDQSDWAKRSAAAIGERIAHYRGGKLSAQQLAERCAELGMPSISRIVITKLENGRRETVSTAELLVLGQALGVPPILLLFPVGSASAIEALPGVKASPWEACRWFLGGAGVVSTAQTDPDSPLALWGDHENLLARIARNREAATHIVVDAEQHVKELKAQPAVETVDSETADRVIELAHDTARVIREREVEPDLRILRSVRARIRQLGLTPPEVDPETARELELAPRPLAWEVQLPDGSVAPRDVEPVLPLGVEEADNGVD